MERSEHAQSIGEDIGIVNGCSKEVSLKVDGEIKKFYVGNNEKRTERFGGTEKRLLTLVEY